MLAIGVSQYQRDEYRRGLPAKDARDFAAAMQKHKGGLYTQVELRVLTDRDATREAVLKGLDWLGNSAGRNDVGMLFLAGHGLNQAADQYYFLPFDGLHDRLTATAVPEQTIRQKLARIRGKALFFVDTCFAGNVAGALRGTNRELARLSNDLASSENGVIVFASNSGRQQSEEKDEWGNGAFTKALIAGIPGKADLDRSGRITFKGLDYYVSEEVTRLTQGRQTLVRNTTSVSSEDRFFLRDFFVFSEDDQCITPEWTLGRNSVCASAVAQIVCTRHKLARRVWDWLGGGWGSDFVEWVRASARGQMPLRGGLSLARFWP